MKSKHADVLVVGAGAAGVAAAVEAAERGARVAVIEAAAQPGGTAVDAGGGILVAGSDLQARLGIEDGPQAALDDWLEWGGGSVDVDWARRYVEASSRSIYGWLARLGVRWGSLHLHEGNRVPRWHAPHGGGRAIMQALLRCAYGHRSIAWHVGSRARKLITAGGEVVGVQAVGAAGAEEYRSSAVLIASGGFCNSATMVRRYATAVRPTDRILLGGGSGATGQGHDLLSDVRAGFANLTSVWIYPYGTPDPRDPSGQRGLAIRGLDGDIWVDRGGQRFHDEARRGGATGTAALLALEPASCWSIIDARIARRVRVAAAHPGSGGSMRRGVPAILKGSPFVFRGATLDELADRAGIDREGLRRTLASANELRMHRADGAPGAARPANRPPPLTRPPFYATQFFPLARKNLGGVSTDADCQVLAVDGRLIPGLFAAGEVAGMAGGHINGRAALEGTMLGPSLYSGRVAGARMAS